MGRITAFLIACDIALGAFKSAYSGLRQCRPADSKEIKVMWEVIVE